MMGQRIIMLAGLVLLSGCISLIPEPGPGPDIYRLSTTVETGHQPIIKQTILLPVIQAPRELRNNRVALIRSSQTISYAANARWAASTPEMLQAFLADRFREQGAIQVIFPKDGINAPREVLVRLLKFEASYDQGTESAPLAIVAFRVQLIDRGNRTLIAEKKFRSTARSVDARLGSIVRSIDQASAEAASNITSWLGEHD